MSETVFVCQKCARWFKADSDFNHDVIHCPYCEANHREIKEVKK